MFWSVGWPLLWAGGFFCNLDILYGGLGIGKLQFLIKIFYFFSAVIFFNFWSLKPWIRIGSGSVSGIVLASIRIHWIRIRIRKKWIRIRNTDPHPGGQLNTDESTGSENCLWFENVPVVSLYLVFSTYLWCTVQFTVPPLFQDCTALRTRARTGRTDWACWWASPSWQDWDSGRSWTWPSGSTPPSSPPPSSSPPLSSPHSQVPLLAF